MLAYNRVFVEVGLVFLVALPLVFVLHRRSTAGGGGAVTLHAD